MHAKKKENLKNSKMVKISQTTKILEKFSYSLYISVT